MQEYFICYKTKKKSNRLTAFWNLWFHKIKNLYFWKAFLDKKGKPQRCPKACPWPDPEGASLQIIKGSFSGPWDRGDGAVCKAAPKWKTDG